MVSEQQQIFFSIIYVLGPLLSTLNILHHLCLTIILWSKYHDGHPQLYGRRNWETRIFSKLSQIIQLVSGTTGIQTQPIWQQSPWVNHWKYSLLRDCLEIRNYHSKEFMKLITAENLLSCAEPDRLVHRYKYIFICIPVCEFISPISSQI